MPSPEEKFDSYQTRALGSLYRFPVRRYVRKLFNPDSVRLQFTVQDFSLDSELNIKSDITESELLTTIYTTSDWRKKADRIISTVTDYLVEQDIPYLVGELPITQ